MTDNDDRDRGVLSPADRRFLKSPGEYSRQATHERETAIQERVWNAFLDGSVLFRHASPQRRREMFDGWREYAETGPGTPGDEYEKRQNQATAEMVEQLKAEAGFDSWISFLYLGLSESDEFNFDTTLRAGIESAEESRGRVVTDLDFDVDTRERRSLDELTGRFERRQKLTTEEIQRLRAAGEITDGELVAYYDELAGPVHGDGGG